MGDLLRKLNYKGYKRIALINAEEDFKKAFSEELKDIITDFEIDQRCPYEFMILFVRTLADVERLAPAALHNLTADGILWFCYPKKTSGNTLQDRNGIKDGKLSIMPDSTGSGWSLLMMTGPP